MKDGLNYLINDLGKAHYTPVFDCTCVLYPVFTFFSGL